MTRTPPEMMSFPTRWQRRAAGTVATLAWLGAAACDDPAGAERRDTTAPAVVMSRPTVDTLYVTTVGAPHRPRVEGTATDETGVVRVAYQLSGKPEVEVPITPGPSVSYSFQFWLDEGDNTLVIHAYDAAGNRGSSVARRMKQDSNGPVVRALSPAEGRAVTEDPVRVTATVTDPAGVARAIVRVNHTVIQDQRLSGDSVTVAFSVSLRLGVNQLELELHDGNGIRTWKSFQLSRGGLTFRSASLGRSELCAVTPVGAAYCGAWDGMVGPAQAGGTHDFREVSAGDLFACGVTRDDRAFCWGSNSSGQLGNGSHEWESSVPTAVPGGIAFRSVSAGYVHTCGVSTADVAYCWGSNGFVSGVTGLLGNGTGAADVRAPVAVAGGIRFRSVSAGRVHTCALTPEGRAYCWGDNAGGQLGTGNRSGSATPAAVAGGLTFRSIHVGSTHTCALGVDGRAYCWGTNLLGELGTGEYQQGATPTLAPVAVSTDRRFTSLATGALHSCGVAEDGAAWCWGDNLAGQLGTGTTAGSAIPVRVSGGFVFRGITAREGRTCAVGTNDWLRCWGDRVTVPVMVSGQ